MSAYAGPIEHVVVLMFENRSYDNVLGLLYDRANPPPYDVAPDGQRDLDGLQQPRSNADVDSGAEIFTWGGPNDATTIPAADPGEPFDDMAQQLLGLAQPLPLVNPYAFGPGLYGEMGGFVANYRRRQPKANASDVMHAFVPQLMPVTAFLAHRFMVCDRWFASAPTQTFANRLFAHAASPAELAVLGLPLVSHIDDFEYALAWNRGYDLEPNVFSQLDAVHGVRTGADGAVLPNWKVYFHDYSISAGLLGYAARKLTDPQNVNLANYNGDDYPAGYTNPIAHPATQFLEDVRNGALPKYAFIEPRYSNSYPGAKPGLNVSSNHPGVSNYTFKAFDPNSPIDVRYGERLLYDVYEALRTSASWEKTLLIVTYDEHGGVYDHVFPPAATPPGPSVRPTGGGFGFDLFGGRVPAIVVSPYAAPHSTLRPPAGAPAFDHTSLIKTVWECFGLDAGPHGRPSINARDAAAPSVLPALATTVVNEPAPAPAPPG
jgi:phospholipase C